MRLLSGKRVFFCAERQSYANILIRDNYNFLGGPLAPLGSCFARVPYMCGIATHIPPSAPLQSLPRRYA